jgi:protoporphyrinogen oxidase
MNKKYVIAGSGVSGMLSALLLLKHTKGENIYLIDKNAELGGLLRKFDYGEEYGTFDYGMHNMLETGIKELDSLLFGLLPENEWQVLDQDKRDLAGIFFNGKLQKHTPYIDIRNLPIDDYLKCLDDFFANFTQNASLKKEDEIAKNAYQFAVDRFGKFTAENTIIPALEKNYRVPANELDYMATIFTPMSRIAMFDEPITNEILKSNLLNDRIAFSDQRNLPLENSSGRRAYYPAKYGIYRIIDAITKVLTENGVNIMTQVDIVGLDFTENNGINAIEIKKNNESIKIENIKKLIWTLNSMVLGRLLKVDFTGLKFNKPQKTIIVNILIDKPLDMGDLYYLFCYEKGFNTYRLTNFTNYCKGAPRNGLYPVSIELLIPEDKMVSEEELANLAVTEMKNFNILFENTKVVFQKAEILDSGFPMPTVSNISSMKYVRESIIKLNLNNLLLVGILAEPNLFFQTDVMADVFKKLNK